MEHQGHCCFLLYMVMADTYSLAELICSQQHAYGHIICTVAACPCEVGLGQDSSCD